MQRKEKDENTRIAIVNPDKCKPKQCSQECKKSCPVVMMGKECITINNIANISEKMCNGCGICTKKCPFNSIEIINIPKQLEHETIHRYGENTFKLHRLPIPKKNCVLGLVGTNGIGKSTAMKILGNKLKPNFGNYSTETDYKDLIKYYRGSDLQNYFSMLATSDATVSFKPQYIEVLTKAIKGKVKDFVDQKSDLIEKLDLSALLERDISQLSGGEIQRFALYDTCKKDANVYIFDEPSSYLDIKQRLKMAQLVREMCVENEKYVIVSEHDLSVLDYMSDHICCLYGKPAAYGVVTHPFTVRDGINIFLSGYIPTENMRFRDFELTFKVVENIVDIEIDKKKVRRTKYPVMSKTFDKQFKLEIEEGYFEESEIIVLLAQNGMGKTTFVRMLAGLEQPDSNSEIPTKNVSYKPQQIIPTFDGTVREYLQKNILNALNDLKFTNDVIKPMNLTDIMDNNIKTLSGGQLQKIAIVRTLGTPADMYLIDEPSTYLDCEQRIIVAKIIKHFMISNKKSCFVVEHDFLMSLYLADRVIVYEGTPSVMAIATAPQDLVSGMNKFLKQIGITFRRDVETGRPRINKLDSQKDKEQKISGNYFYNK